MCVLAWRSTRLESPALLFVMVSFLNLPVLTMITITITLVFHLLWLVWTGLELGRNKP
jgi:hypothetical protein